MKVKLLVSRSGNGIVQNRGDIIDVSVEEAESLINAGQAEVQRDAPVERAVAKPRVERATGD
jgi:hypothetical protein